MAVPVGAAMSIPAWWRPQRGPNSDVGVPLTGDTIVDEPQSPVTLFTGNVRGAGLGVSGAAVSRRSSPPAGWLGSLSATGCVLEEPSCDSASCSPALARRAAIWRLVRDETLST